MNKILLSFFTIVSLSLTSFGQGYKIDFDIKHLDDSVVYLARYFGDNKYIKDTIVVNGKEKFSISGKEALPCGIYLLVREKRNAYFEFIINQQEFKIISDTSDFIGKTQFVNSPENTQLYDYFRFAGALGKKADQLLKEKKDSTTTAERRTIIDQELQALNKESEAYKNKFIEEHPENPMSVVFNIQKEVEFPDSILADTTVLGEMRRYQYYLDHYWDNTDFSSPCVIRSPVFHPKMQRYFDKFIPQHFDSAIVYIEKLIEKVKGNPELFKYVVQYTSFKWESGSEKRMCWDKVFHHMATNYYMKGLCDWTDSVQLAKIESRAKDLKYVLCGDPAVNLKMKYYPTPGLYDTSGTLHELYKVPSDYIIMWFWDSDCGHCKKQTPKLWDVYQKYKGEGKSIEVYAINIEQESKGYKDYLKEHQYTWLNVQDTGNFSSFRKYYDIYSTPVAYILDKERRIIGKRLDPEGIEKFLDQYFKEEEEQK